MTELENPTTNYKSKTRKLHTKVGINEAVDQDDPDEMARETIAMFDNLLGSYSNKINQDKDNVLLSNVID